MKKTHSFSGILPELKLLESGLPVLKEVDSTTYKCKKYFEESGGKKKLTEISLIGGTITFDIIKKELGAVLIEEKFRESKKAEFTAWRTNEEEPTFKKLMIFCDKLDISNTTLWLPECDIIVRSESVIMAGAYLSSSPKPWKQSFADELLETNSNDGKNGSNAGNIEISCNYIDAKEAEIIAQGTDGESLYAPEVKVDWPKVTTHIEIYKNMGCRNQGSGNSLGYNYKESDYIVGAVYKNYDKKMFGTDRCTGYQEFDDTDGIKFSRKAEGDSIMVDTKKNRLTFKENKPGKGGNGGEVTIVATEAIGVLLPVKKGTAYFTTRSPIKSDLKILRDSGKGGSFYPRTNSDNITYTKYELGACEGIEIKKRQYKYLYFSDITSAIAGVMWNYGGEKKKDAIKIPTNKQVNTINDFISRAGNSTNGISGHKTISSNSGLPANNSYDSTRILLPYTAHEDLLAFKVALLKEEYKSYFKLNIEQKQKLDQKLATIIDLLKDLEKDTDDENKKSIFNSLLIKTLSLDLNKSKNLDEYNNGPGYRPILSLVATLNYINTNLKEDIKLFVYADRMAMEEKDAGAFLKKIPSIIKGLQFTNNFLLDKLTEVDKKYKGIIKQSNECKKVTDTLKEKLDLLEIEMKEQAGSDQKKMALLKAGLKTCALAVSVIPYGQPALAQIGGTSLNALADNLDSFDASNNMSANIIDSIDLSGMLEEIPKRKFRKFKPKSTEYKEVDWSKIQVKDLPGDVNFKGTTKYKADVEKYNNKLKNSKNRYSKVGVQVPGIMSNWLKNTCNKSAIDKRLASLKSSSVMFNDIINKIEHQLKLKQAFFKELNAHIVEVVAINEEIFTNTETISELQRLALVEVKYDEGVETVMDEIKISALNRLKWIEYQLIKTYEYSMLSTFSVTKTKFSTFEELYSRDKDKSKTWYSAYKADSKEKVKDKTLEDVVVDEFFNLFKGEQKNIYNELLMKADKSAKDDSEFGRKLILINTSNRRDFSTKTLAELNEKFKTEIDLQKDLIEMIIKPEESETRIKEIFIDSFEFDRVLPESMSIDIVVDLGYEGVLRKKDAFYAFNGYKNNKPSDRWKWTISRAKKGEEAQIDTRSIPSKQYIELLKNITGSPVSTENLFTSSPAWSKLSIKIKYNGVENMEDLPQLKKLIFNICCQYSDEINENKKVLDVKIIDNVTTTPYSVSYGGKIIHKNDNHYDLIEKDSLVTLEISEANKQFFDHWDIYGSGIGVSDLDLKNPKLTIEMTNDIRIRAKFKPKRVLLKSSGAKQEDIVLYSKPSESSKIIASVKKTSEYQDVLSVSDNLEKFRPVLYGLQEVYLKNN